MLVWNSVSFSLIVYQHSTGSMFNVRSGHLSSEQHTEYISRKFHYFPCARTGLSSSVHIPRSDTARSRFYTEEPVCNTSSKPMQAVGRYRGHTKIHYFVILLSKKKSLATLTHPIK